MTPSDGFRRYVEAAMALTQITRSRAEEVVRDLIRAGELESTKAQDWVEDLLRTSRQRSEAFASTVRSEVRRQLSDVGLRDLNDLARRVAAILDKAGDAARRAGRSGTGRRPAKRPGTTAAGRAGAARRSSAGSSAAAKKATAAAKKKAAGTKRSATGRAGATTAAKKAAKKATNKTAKKMARARPGARSGQAAGAARRRS